VIFLLVANSKSDGPNKLYVYGETEIVILFVFAAFEIIK
jgi:hypothetical protein